MNYKFKPNNKFNKRIVEELPREFSLEDIDGVIRFHYEEFKKTRLIIYEIKSVDEPEPQKPQLLTLNILRESINWSRFDNQSGVFIIKGLDENFNKTDIKQIISWQDKRIDEPEYKNIGIVDFSYYRKWFYNDENLEIKKDISLKEEKQVKLNLDKIPSKDKFYDFFDKSENGQLILEEARNKLRNPFKPHYKKEYKDYDVIILKVDE